MFPRLSFPEYSSNMLICVLLGNTMLLIRPIQTRSSVSVQLNYGYGFQHACGGAIINERWILTAAHCVERKYGVRALAGLHKVSEPNAPTVQNIKIAKIVMHSYYDNRTYYNDLALLETANPIDFAGSNGYINNICPPVPDKKLPNYARVAGWGLTQYKGELSDVLKSVKVPIVHSTTCNKVYDRNLKDAHDAVNENMICAGMYRKDSCGNDSGGPLFVKNQEGEPSLIGVVSFGKGCGESRYPGVYTKVSSYKNWIDTIIYGRYLI